MWTIARTGLACEQRLAMPQARTVETLEKRRGEILQAIAGYEEKIVQAQAEPTHISTTVAISRRATRCKSELGRSPPPRETALNWGSKATGARSLRRADEQLTGEAKEEVEHGLAPRFPTRVPATKRCETR